MNFSILNKPIYHLGEEAGDKDPRLVQIETSRRYSPLSLGVKIPLPGVEAIAVIGLTAVRYPTLAGFRGPP